MVYSSIAANSYQVYSVSQAFVDEPTCLHCDTIGWYYVAGYIGNSSEPSNYTFQGNTFQSDMVTNLHRKARAGELVRMEPLDCMNAYATMIQSFHRNLLLVGPNDAFPPAARPYEDPDTPFGGEDIYNGTHIYKYSESSVENLDSPRDQHSLYSWICEDLESEDGIASFTFDWCDMGRMRNNASTWHVNNYPVEYCLSEPAPSNCKLHILLPIGWLVTVLNLFKAVLILYTAFWIKENPLMNMGDAVASFMERPDHATNQSCLITVRDVKKQKRFKGKSDFRVAEPKRWTSYMYRWRHATSRMRLFAVLFM